MCQDAEKLSHHGDCHRQLPVAVKDKFTSVVSVVFFMISDQLLSLCLLSFECLNTASSRDLCLASIEEAFFTPLWSALVALFR